MKKIIALVIATILILPQQALCLRPQSARHIDLNKKPAASGLINITRYMIGLEDDNSAACEELRKLYRDEWELRRGRLITLLKRYKQLYPSVKKVCIARGPGRVTTNEHTDYHDATAMGIPTIQDDIIIAGINPEGNNITFNNIEPEKFPVGIYDAAVVPTVKIQPKKRKSDVFWGDFSVAILQGIAARLRSYGTDALPGMCILADGREEYGGIPIESNISSSAGYEEALIYAVEALTGHMGKMTGGEVIEIGREAEAKIGFPCGKLDQGSSTMGRVIVETGQIKGAAIDCVPRLDENSRDMTIIEPFDVPPELEAILVDTGPKERAQQEYNIRVIEGELGAWILAHKLAELSDDFSDFTARERIFKAAYRLYGNVNTDHNGKPYLLASNMLYPVFFKAAFFAKTRLEAIGINVTEQKLTSWICNNLSPKVKIQSLIAQYGREFLDFYVKSAMPFHCALLRSALQEAGKSDGVDEQTLNRWVEAWLRNNLKSVSAEMANHDLTPEIFKGLGPSVYNLQGTILHAIGEEDRVPLIKQALKDAVTKSGKARTQALEEFGDLQKIGYESLRDNYRNSTKNIDTIARWANAQAWCLGARHFGAGWGGWMQIWIKPGQYSLAQAALQEFLSGKPWYADVAASNKRSVEQQLKSGVKPFKPGAPASVLGANGISNADGFTLAVSVENIPEQDRIMAAKQTAKIGQEEGVAVIIHLNVTDRNMKSIPDEIDLISKACGEKVIIDVHVMLRQENLAFQFLVNCASKGASIITLDWEKFQDKEELVRRFELLKRRRIRTGLGINPATNIAQVQDFTSVHDCVDMILQMGTSAQPSRYVRVFDHRAIDNIAKLRESFAGTIAIEGPLDQNKIQVARDAGATIFVVDEAFFGKGLNGLGESSMRNSCRALFAALTTAAQAAGHDIAAPGTAIHELDFASAALRPPSYTSAANPKTPARGAIHATNIPDFSAELITFDGTKRVVCRDGLRKLDELLDMMAEEKIPIGTLYLHGIFEPSSLSKIIHGQKWDNGAELVRVGPVSALVGYRTKHESVQLPGEEGVVELSEIHGNHFSTYGPMEISRTLLQDAEESAMPMEIIRQIKALFDKAHKLNIKVAIDFIPWFSPDFLTSENYKWFLHKDVSELPEELQRLTDKELLEWYERCVILHIEDKAGAQRRILVLLRDDDSAVFSQDQIRPNIFNRDLQDYYRRALKFWVDLGVDSFRVDLAQQITRNFYRHIIAKHEHVGRSGFLALEELYANEDEPMYDIFKEVQAYARMRCSREVTFLLESYPPYERNRFNAMGFPTYYKDLHDAYLALSSSPGNADNNDLFKAFDWVLKNRPNCAIFFGNYDDEAFEDLSGPKKAAIACEMALSLLGVPTIVCQREWIQQAGEIVPVPGGKSNPVSGTREEGAKAIFVTHKFTTGAELVARDTFDKLKELIRGSPYGRILKLFDELTPAATDNNPELLNSPFTHFFIPISWKMKNGDIAVLFTDFRKDGDVMKVAIEAPQVVKDSPHYDFTCTVAVSSDTFAGQSPLITNTPSLYRAEPSQQGFLSTRIENIVSYPNSWQLFVLSKAKGAMVAYNLSFDPGNVAALASAALRPAAYVTDQKVRIVLSEKSLH